MAVRGVARPGPTWQGVAPLAWHGMARPGPARRGIAPLAWHGPARRGRLGVAGMAGRGLAGRGTAWRGMAGEALLGAVGEAVRRKAGLALGLATAGPFLSSDF